MGQIRGHKHLRRRRDARLEVAQAIKLRLAAGLSYDELAAALGVASSTVWASLEPVRSVVDPIATDRRQRRRAVGRAMSAALAALSK